MNIRSQAGIMRNHRCSAIIAIKTEESISIGANIERKFHFTIDLKMGLRVTINIQHCRNGMLRNIRRTNNEEAHG